MLPGASFFEKSGTFTNGERRVQRVNEVIPPLAGTKTDGQIVVDIMNRMGVPQPDYTPDGVLAEIARVVPFFKGAVWEKLVDNGVQLVWLPALVRRSGQATVQSCFHGGGQILHGVHSD